MCGSPAYILVQKRQRQLSFLLNGSSGCTLRGSMLAACFQKFRIVAACLTVPGYFVFFSQSSTSYCGRPQQQVEFVVRYTMEQAILHRDLL